MKIKNKIILSNESLFKSKSNYLHRKITGIDVLISIGENIANFNGYIEMNETASYIWDHLKEFIHLDDLSQLLASEFEITYEQAREDVIEFLTLLNNHEMVEVKEG